MAIHLGTMIKDYCRKNNVSSPQLATYLGITTDAIYKMFKTSNLKIETVYKVSFNLKHDFFQYYQQHLEPNIYNQASKLEKENKLLKDELQTLKVEVEIYKKLLKLSPEPGK